MPKNTKRIVTQGGNYSPEDRKKMEQEGVLPQSELSQAPSEGVTHKVSKGDTLSAIAKKYNLKIKDLLAANPEFAKNPNAVPIGASINVPRLADIHKAEEAKKLQEQQGEKWSVDRILGNIKREGGKALEQIGKIPGKAGEFIEKNPSLVGAAANIAGGVAGYGLSQQATDEAFKDIGRARGGYEAIQKQTQAIKPSEELMAARKAGIEGIRQRAEMGLTPEDQAMLRQVQAQQLRQGAAARQAAEEAASRRGAQGGQDIIAALQGAGQAQQIASEQADRLAAESFRAKQQALRDLTTASQAGISGDFSQDIARAKQAADIQENIGKTYTTEADLQTKKAAQLAGLGQAVGSAVSTPLNAYAQAQRERMANTPAPEEKQQTELDKFNANQNRPELKNKPATPKKDKSVVGQATSGAQKVQKTVGQVQGAVDQAKKATEQFKNVARAFGETGIPFRK